MSGMANASAEVIERFKNDNIDFCSCLSDYKSRLIGAISELDTLCNIKLSAYKAMFAEAEGVLSQARKKQTAAKAQLSACSAKASSIPKTVKESCTASDSQPTTREKPNPAYAAAQAELNDARRRVQAADNAVTNAVRMKEQLNARYVGIENIGRSIGSLRSDIMPAIDRASCMAESVTENLKKALYALRDYLEYHIR